MAVKVKICGITSAAQAQMVAAAGADALGVVLYPPSPRAVTLERATEVAAASGPFCQLVALLVNSDRAAVEQVIERLRPGLLQFHGDETAEFCEQFNYPYIRAIRVRPGDDVEALASGYKSARGLLFDAWDERRFGGTGQQFDWSLLPANCPAPLILAGGLEPDNVAGAVASVAPYAVDVSGGVESAPGIKCPRRVAAFIAAAKSPGAAVGDAN